MNSFPQNSAVVLVHGAWADGSCWRDVILLLEREGLQVLTAVQRPISVQCIQEDAPEPGCTPLAIWWLR
jgi:hypothetical protein